MEFKKTIALLPAILSLWGYGYAETVNSNVETCRFSFGRPDALDKNGIPSFLNVKNKSDELKFSDLFAKEGEPYAEELKFVAGHLPGRKAVRLNQCCLKGKPIAPGTDGFSIEFWIRIVAKGTVRDYFMKDNMTIMSAGNGYNDGWRLAMMDGSVFTLIMGTPSKRISTGFPEGIEGKWMFISVTWDGRNIKLYKNASQKAAVTTDEKYITPSNGRFVIGLDRGHGWGSLVFDIDEWTFYNYPLTPPEIVKHYKDEPHQ